MTKIPPEQDPLGDLPSPDDLKRIADDLDLTDTYLSNLVDATRDKIIENLNIPSQPPPPEVEPMADIDLSTFFALPATVSARPVAPDSPAPAKEPEPVADSAPLAQDDPEFSYVTPDTVDDTPVAPKEVPDDLTITPATQPDVVLEVEVETGQQVDTTAEPQKRRVKQAKKGDKISETKVGQVAKKSPKLKKSDEKLEDRFKKRQRKIRKMVDDDQKGSVL